LILPKLGIGWVLKENIEKILILKESLIFKTKSNGTLFLMVESFYSLSKTI